MSIEQIVRPFQQSTAIVSRDVVSRALKVPREKARLVWGGAGAMPTPEKETAAPGGFSFKVEDCKQGLQEQSRKYGKVIRTTQDGNPDNYLDWSPIVEITFKPEKDNGVNPASGFINLQMTDFAPTADFSNDFEKLYQCKAASNTYKLNQP